MYTLTDFINFLRYFKSDIDCLRYIADIKWPNNQYKCLKCGHNNYCKGKQELSRRCTKCKYDESIKAHTAFENLGFDILLAFHILYRLSVKKKGMSSYELSKEYSLSQKTCFNFRNKVQMIMKSSEKHPLTGFVDVDEFVVGGPEEGKKGRSHGKKKLIIVALERVNEKQFGRAYARHIKDFSSKQFRPFFDSHISREAKLRTDNWASYKPLKKDYPYLEQEKSDDGKNFRELHIHIMNFKSWLRGIHHHCSQDYMQGYLNEYHFRFNRRNHLDTIFHNLIKKMVHADIQLSK